MVDIRAQNEINAWFAAQMGLVTRAQALGAGWSPRQIDRLVSMRGWTAIQSGVYRHAAAPVTREQALLGGVLAAGAGSAVSHRAAVGAWGVRGYRAVILEVSRPRPTRFVLRGAIVVHRARDLRDGDVTVNDGLPVTTPARTLVDLGAVMPSVVERCMEEWLADRVVSLDAIHQALSDHAGRGAAASASCDAS